MQWFYIRDGQRIGPVEDGELFRLAREGQLGAGDLVWNPTMGQEWKPASSIPALFAPAAAAPAVAESHRRVPVGWRQRLRQDRFQPHQQRFGAGDQVIQGG